MSVVLDRPAARPRGIGLAWLGVCLLAGGALLLGGSPAPTAPPALRLPIEQAWPKAQRAAIAGHLDDGPLFTPGLFLDATTVVGTAPSPDARWLRLVVRTADGAVRQLHRLPYDRDPEFGAFARSGDDVLWAQDTEDAPVQIWAANLRAGTPARRLTADAGGAVFSSTQYDLVVAAGRVYWTAVRDRSTATEIRSVALGGGTVQIHTEPGKWALSAWPWLSADNRLRNLSTGRDIEAPSPPAGLTTCTPAWCRVMVMTSSGDLHRIDLMHPDGTARRRIAGGAARAAVAEIAILDRFEILYEPGPESDLTGTAKLLVYDIGTGQSVDVSAAAGRVATGEGVLWWATGDDTGTVWHSLDLRTV
ncbi:hypothetical protein EV385_5368 [Krasilnikovia cinnamomea]|uniref:WD40 repeat protein n=1 Tax=Krasilnikovia cinnamomea TaxID=349313 RepID=A0A4Q7ZRK6_9ACTN|nr:hypothetical protein [Krasilnikovia cinnamomea]RZU53441.1 hypothetical protein EV385_5368 [Krasilnikovia cinnamomea]